MRINRFESSCPIDVLSSIGVDMVSTSLCCNYNIAIQRFLDAITTPCTPTLAMCRRPTVVALINPWEPQQTASRSRGNPPRSFSRATQYGSCGEPTAPLEQPAVAAWSPTAQPRHLVEVPVSSMKIQSAGIELGLIVRHAIRAAATSAYPARPPERFLRNGDAGVGSKAGAQSRRPSLADGDVNHPRAVSRLVGGTRRVYIFHPCCTAL